MNAIEELIKKAPSIEEKIGYQFKDRLTLALAFVHRSFINENREITQHNERLEFLGDSVLGLLVADHLYRFLPTTPEGSFHTCDRALSKPARAWHMCRNSMWKDIFSSERGNG